MRQAKNIKRIEKNLMSVFKPQVDIFLTVQNRQECNAQKTTKSFPTFCPKNQGLVVQSIISLTSSLKGQLVKCFMTLLLNTLIFFAEKMREAFALQKLLTVFQQKMLAYLRY